MSTVTDVVVSEAINPVVDSGMIERAKEVREQLLQVKDKIEDSFFDLCELLQEAQEFAFHTVWGYSRFGDWVEQASELDISARQAYYYIAISQKARALGCNRELMKQAKISKLREIFSLDPKEHGEQMKALLAAAPTTSLDIIKARVRVLKTKGGQPEQLFMTLKVSAEIKETIDKAVELARKNYGDTVSNGEIVEASLSKCIELICVSYLQDDNNIGEQVAA